MTLPSGRWSLYLCWRAWTQSKQLLDAAAGVTFECPHPINTAYYNINVKSAHFIAQSLHRSLVNQMLSVYPLYCVRVLYRRERTINSIQSSSLRFFLSIVSLWLVAYGQFILSSILNGPFLSLIIITALIDVFPFQGTPLSWANLIKQYHSTVSLIPLLYHAALPRPRDNEFLSCWDCFLLWARGQVTG